MMLLLSIIMVVSFVGATIIKTKAIPDSISSMVYVLPDGSARWLWTIWLWLVTVLLAPSLIDALSDKWQFIGFLMISCLLFTGAMPIFMKEHKKAHNVLGVTAGILSQVCVVIIDPWWLLLWGIPMPLLVGAFASFNDSPETPDFCDGKGVFFAECICAASLYGALLVTF